MARQRDSREDPFAEQRLESLFRAHYAAVLAYVRRRAAAESVDDVVAETFLVAWRRLDHVPADSPLPWLLAIARNIVATQRRSALRRDALYLRLQASVNIPAADALSAEALTDAMAAALARLNEKDMEALTLIGWDGLRPREAAAAMGELPSAFYVRLHRAKRRLRRLLDERSEQSSGVPVPNPLDAKEPIP
jgi:RNA polymerase sigma-70 factor (ECF subfamily)